MPGSMSYHSNERDAFLEAQSPRSSTSSTLGGFWSDTEAQVQAEDLPLKHRPSSPGLSRLSIDGCFSSRRSLRRTVRRIVRYTYLKYIAVVLVAVLVLTPILIPSYANPPPHYHDLVKRCSSSITAEGGCANPWNEKIFISISLYDQEGRLADGQWGRLVLDLIHLLGPDNVFLSIYENDVGPHGSSALEHLEAKLSCRHRVVNDAHMSMNDFPTTRMPDGSDRVKRIAYLSEIRNRALRPLDMLNQTELGSAKFDKVLFLNDVIFNPTDAANLLFSTNIGVDGRAQYLSACAMDFVHPWKFYDVFALRDAEGFRGDLNTYPFFGTEGSAISRTAVLRQSDAVPVKSCWGGMVAMQAEYVQNRSPALPSSDFQQIGSHVVEPDAPRNVTSPVRFRYEPEIFFEACECCLFLADVSRVANSQGATELGTYVNPYVRTAYTQAVFRWLSWARYWERLLIVSQWISASIWGASVHNPYRAVEQGEIYLEEVWFGPGPGYEEDGQVPGSWQLVQRTGRNGMFCGVREMQVLLKTKRSGDINWENTRMPAGQSLDFPTLWGEVQQPGDEWNLMLSWRMKEEAEKAEAEAASKSVGQGTGYGNATAESKQLRGNKWHPHRLAPPHQPPR